MDIEKRRKQKLKWYYKNKEQEVKRSREWRKKNIEQARENQRNWSEKNRLHVRERDNKYLAKIKHQALEAYCGDDISCICCGEKYEIMLSIDHIGKDGAEHRRKIGSKSKQLYLWLRKNNYPLGYRVLCINCNVTLGTTGSCPHSDLTQ